PTGAGCSVADLCAPGWHVCVSQMEVAARAKSGACPTDGGAGPVFWVTRQTMDTSAKCVPDGAASGHVNNVVGCGLGLGEPPDPTDDCGPLDVIQTAAECASTTAWTCGPDA